MTSNSYVYAAGKLQQEGVMAEEETVQSVAAFHERGSTHPRVDSVRISLQENITGSRGWVKKWQSSIPSKLLIT